MYYTYSAFNAKDEFSFSEKCIHIKAAASFQIAKFSDVLERDAVSKNTDLEYGSGLSYPLGRFFQQRGFKV
jgi:hypothetical protein